MRKPVENEKHKIYRDFEIKMDPPILARNLDLVNINRKKKS